MARWPHAIPPLDLAEVQRGHAGGRSKWSPGLAAGCFTHRSKRASDGVTMAEDSVVFFLGAGASRAFGYPLTNDILPLVNDCLRDEKLFPDRNVVPPVRGEYGRQLNPSGFLPNAMKVLLDDMTELLPGAFDAAALRPPPGVTPL